MVHCLAGICNDSLWTECLAFRGHIPIPPPSGPMVRHRSLSLKPPTAPSKAVHTEQTCLYLCSSPFVFFLQDGIYLTVSRSLNALRAHFLLFC